MDLQCSFCLACNKYQSHNLQCPTTSVGSGLVDLSFVRELGITGQLRLYELSNITSIVYLGMQNSITGEIENKRTDVLLNYVYLETIGTYKKET